MGHPPSNVEGYKVIAVTMEFLVWLMDFLFSKRKTYHGRHWTDTVDTVPVDYHPTPEMLAYPGLWEARCSERFDYLRVPLKTFNVLMRIGREIDRVVSLSNYRWKDVPMNEWPEVWSVQNGRHN